MTETSAPAVSPSVEQVKAKSPKKKATKGGLAKAKSSHPPTALMVNSAIRSLKARGGSSLKAIKKYITSTYKVDAEKMAPFIKKYIKTAVAGGQLVQTKGVGAAGSFKLPGAPSGEGKVKKTPSKTKTVKPKKTNVVKATKPKKEKKSATPSKVKRAKKPPTTPKAPKPKKVNKKSPAKPKKALKKSPAKKAVAKKAAPKKK